MPINSKRQAHPDEVTIADFISWTKNKLILSNVGPGGIIYPNCTPFSVDEVMKHLGIYISWNFSFTSSGNEIPINKS